MNISTPTMIDELFVLNKDGCQRQITNLNGPLFSELKLIGAGRDLVHQLRRQEDSGVDSEAA